jgi:AGCS family alanine or glycine:cation symporter
MYYIENGLGWKWLAVIFAIFATLASFGIGNMTQANSVATALNGTLGISPAITGIVLVVIVAVVILGGIKRIASVTEKLVPVMGVLYVILGVITIILNINQLPAAFATIFEAAFNPEAVVGGGLGYTIMRAVRYGFARGVFSNEAGLGSAPIAHAAANTDNPVKQGMWGAFEVIFDTFIICSITGLVVVMSGLWMPGTDLNGASLAITAFSNSVGMFGTVGVTLGTVLFALSTLLGWSYYGEKSIEYLFKGQSFVGYVKLGYKVVFIALVFVGSVGGLTLIWDIADTLNGLMAIPNLIALVLLSGTVTKLIKEFFAAKN